MTGSIHAVTDISYTTRDNETFTGYLAEPDRRQNAGHPC